jgi:hypothetical protein
MFCAHSPQIKVYCKSVWGWRKRRQLLKPVSLSLTRRLLSEENFGDLTLHKATEFPKAG